MATPFNFSFKSSLYLCLMLVFTLCSTNITTLLAQDQVSISLNNPIRTGDDLKLHLEQTTDVKIILADTEGKFVKLFLNQTLIAGDHDISLIVGDVQKGDYLLKLETPYYNDEFEVQINHDASKLANVPMKSVKDMEQQPSKVSLEVASPIFSGESVKLTADRPASVELTLVDKEGKFVKLLLKVMLRAGQHELPVVVSDVPAGEYLLQMDADGKQDRIPVEVMHKR